MGRRGRGGGGKCLRKRVSAEVGESNGVGEREWDVSSTIKGAPREKSQTLKDVITTKEGSRDRSTEIKKVGLWGCVKGGEGHRPVSDQCKPRRL